jgi:hypothetical protein
MRPIRAENSVRWLRNRIKFRKAAVLRTDAPEFAVGGWLLERLGPLSDALLDPIAFFHTETSGMRDTAKLTEGKTSHGGRSSTSGTVGRGLVGGDSFSKGFEEGVQLVCQHPPRCDFGGFSQGNFLLSDSKFVFSTFCRGIRAGQALFRQVTSLLLSSWLRIVLTSSKVRWILVREPFVETV